MDAANPTTPNAAADLLEQVIQRAASQATRRRLIDVWRRIEPDPYLEAAVARLEQRLDSPESYWDMWCVLSAFAEIVRPSRYLEIGVRRGHSACVVAAAHPAVDLYLFDMWYPKYAGVPNPGPNFVRRQSQRAGHQGAVLFVNGRSQETIPTFFDGPAGPQNFELVTVDGDHRDEGARADLLNVIGHLDPGGMLVFDDIAHPAYPTLHNVWRGVLAEHPDFIVRENRQDANGTAVAIRHSDTPDDRLSSSPHSP
jgi:predicted O-methyltransferase YrrM